MDTTQQTSPSALKPGSRLMRGIVAKREAINIEARTVELAFASEEPYIRWWGVEILDLAPKSMRLQRIKSGAPLLCDHDTRERRTGNFEVGVFDVAFVQSQSAIC